MKRYILLFLLLSVFLISSCGKKEEQKNEIKDKVELSIDNETLKEEYYLEEFNISNIKLNVKINDCVDSINLSIDLVEGLSNLKVGLNTLTVNYKEATTTFNVNIVEKEEYTSGLVFRPNEELTEYKVVGYNGTSSSVIIPRIYNHLPVKEISNQAFKDNTIIENVTLNEGLVKIGNSAFQSTIVKSINIPSTVTSIGTAAFYLNDSLDFIYIPSSVKSLGDKALEGVKIIMLEDSLDKHNYSATFMNPNTSYLYENIDHNYLKQNESYVYYKDTIIKYLESNISEVVIPSTIDDTPITKIGDYSFYNHLEITSITLPLSLELIKTHAFHLTNIEEISFSSTLKQIGEYAFAYCEKLVTINFNEGLVKIDHSAFNSCCVLSELKFPSTLTTIDAFAFQNCYVTSKVYIPKSVTFIGNGCFYSNSRAVFYLEASEIPSTWESNWNPSSKKGINYNCDIWS